MGITETGQEIVTGDIITLDGDKVIVQYVDPSGLWDIWGNHYPITGPVVIEYLGNLFDA